MEIWKALPGIDLYEVSNLGRVRSLPRLTTHYTGKRIVRGGRILFGHINPRGYVQVSLSINGRTKTVYVHTLVAVSFLGPRPVGKVVRHLDGDPSNNTAENLAYGTNQENSDDMDLHGTVLRGERHGCAKLTAEDVAKIRELSARHSQAELAAMFRMSNQQINNIVLGRQWRHI